MSISKCWFRNPKMRFNQNLAAYFLLEKNLHLDYSLKKDELC